MDALRVLEALDPVMQFVKEKVGVWGPGLAGALFGAGWWWWVDAVACSSLHIPFSQYLPGLIATFALLMINSVRKDEIESTDAFGDEGVFCRARSWLLAAYMCAIGAIAGSVLVVLHYMGAAEAGDRWPGPASIFQVFFILSSALVFFVTRSQGESGGYDTF